MLLRWAGRGTPRRGRHDAGRDGGLRLLGRLGLASLSSAFVLPAHCASPCLAEDCTATTLRPRPGGLLDGTARAGRGKALWSTRRTAEHSARDDGSDLRVVLQPREPGGEAFDRDLELRVEVEEVAQSLGQPLQRDRLAATPVSYTHLRAHETPEHLVCR